MTASSNSSQVTYFSMEMAGLVGLEFALRSASGQVQNCVGLVDWARRPAFLYPFITAIGRNLATLCARPALWTTSTTSLTSL